MKNKSGFTLLEILIALFVFTIISLILARALHTVINTVSVTEANAARLREVQFTLLLMSRDIEQIIDRPVLAPSGAEEAAFLGTAAGCKFTHTGFADNAMTAHSSLERVAYEWTDHAIWRRSWPVIDQAPQTLPQSRRLLKGVTNAHFEYIDEKGNASDRWPPQEKKQALPRAVKITLTISPWGTLSQLYVIPVKKISPATK